jgi:hypothetical protein
MVSIISVRIFDLVRQILKICKELISGISGIIKNGYTEIFFITLITASHLLQIS